MIIMVESGRLGNQVFQYLALSSCARGDERIRLLGFDQLNSVFTGVRAQFTSIHGNPLRHLQSVDVRRLKRLARILPSTNVIVEDSEGNSLIDRRERLMLAAPSWFQNSRLLDQPALEEMRIRDSWLSRAHTTLAQHGLTPELTAFVHARAGDYRNWPTAQHPAILDPAWYATQAERMSKAIPGIKFIVIGDEPEYRAEVTRAIPSAIAIESGFETEFALMTLCGSGILSASTFAFWGAYFASRTHAAGLFIAPEFWAGHRNGAWYPKAIQSPFLTYA